MRPKDLGQDTNKIFHSKEDMEKALQGRSFNLDDFTGGILVSFYKDNQNASAFAMFGSEREIIKALVLLETKIPPRIKEIRDDLLEYLAEQHKTATIIQ